MKVLVTKTRVTNFPKIVKFVKKNAYVKPVIKQIRMGVLKNVDCSTFVTLPPWSLLIYFMLLGSP